MDVFRHCNSSSRCRAPRKHSYYRLLPFNEVLGGSKLPLWKIWWRKLMKEKRRIFKSSAAPIHVPYDPFTYALNFDPGLSWTDPENLPRSFSVRFAVPVRILQQTALVS